MISSESDSPAVEMIGVTKCDRKSTAVDNLSLNIPRGTTLGLIGPNGAGKSTTIRMLMGTLTPTEGTIRVLGSNIPADAEKMRCKVGYVPERHDIYSWTTVREVIDFTSALRSDLGPRLLQRNARSIRTGSTQEGETSLERDGRKTRTPARCLASS